MVDSAHVDLYVFMPKWGHETWNTVRPDVPLTSIHGRRWWMEAKVSAGTALEYDVYSMLASAGIHRGVY